MIKNTYDSLGRITGINHSRGENILADYHYKWDAANRITEINDDKYGYDKTNQLLSAVYAKKPKEQYAYDLNGNRLNHRIGGNNQLLNDGKEEYQYDAEGNRIAKGDVKYEWDHRNRLVKVETPQETIKYIYDYQNRLVKRSAGKNTTHFIHDGWQIVRQCENGKPVKRFLWGTKQDELLCDNDNWTLGDHLNTIREVVNSDGKVIAHCDYNAFGKRLNAAESSLQFAYTGKLTDSITGLQWNINRWYDSSVGRWISEDPIGFVGRDDNLYRYVENQAPMTIDAYGLAGMPAGPISKYVKKYSFSKTYQIFVPKKSWWEFPLLSRYRQVPYLYKSQTDYEILVNTTYIYNFTLVLIGRDNSGQLNFPVVSSNNIGWQYLIPEIIEQSRDKGFNGSGCRKHYYVTQKCTECTRNKNGLITNLNTYLYTYDLEAAEGITHTVSFLGTHIKCETEPTIDQKIERYKKKYGDNFICKEGTKNSLPSGYVPIEDANDFRFPMASDWVYPYQHRNNNPWE